MGERRRSGIRTATGLALAIVMAPVATALSIELAILLSGGTTTMSIGDLVGGTLTFLVLALVFGTVLAVVPGLVLGGVAIALARRIGTRSPAYFTVVGLGCGLLAAWIDTRRSSSAFDLWDVLPFMAGGGFAALSYWRVAER